MVMLLVTKIDSDIREGSAIISIDGEFGSDTGDQLDDILQEVNQIRPSLPQGISLFDVEQIKPSDRVNFVVFALSSDVASYASLKDIGDDIIDDLEDIDGVNNPQIEAIPQQEVRVELDYERMAALNINLGHVVTTLRSNNVNIPGGDVAAGQKNFSLIGTGGYKNISEIRKTIIGGGDNKVIRLSDIAQVSLKDGDVLWKAEFNQQRSIYLTAKLKRGYNILDVNKTVMDVIKGYQATLPANVDLNVAYEQASGVDARINEFFTSLLQGIALVGIVVFLFLGWRASIVIITVIPICVILSLAILNNAGYGLQQISIASLVIALGLLVDNGIVVTENITRFIKEGYNKKEASLKGASEVGMAITSSTVTTLLSFFPLTQLGEGAGLFIISMPLTVIFTLLISLILALTFSPIMSSWVFSSKPAQRTLADRSFDWFSTRIYRPILKYSLKFGWLIMIIAIALTLFSSVVLFPKIGVSFFPTADKPLLLIDIEAPRGSSLEYTNQAVDFVESIVDTMEIVTNYSSNVGNSNPQIYYNRIPKRFVKNHGQVLINLDEWSFRSFYETISQLRKDFRDYPGVKITVEELKNAAPVKAPIELRVLGENIDVLKDISLQLEHLLEQTEGVINIENPLSRNQTQVNIKLDKEKAGILSVDELSFDQTIRATLNGLQIDNIVLEKDKENYPLVVRMPYEDQPSLSDFNKIYISNQFGGQVPLSHIASLEFEGGPAEFSHFDQERYVSITGSLINLDLTIPTTISIIDELDKMELPDGYRVVVGGEYEEQQSTFGSLGVILLLAQIGIFAVLVLQFRSILQPLIVFAAIPLAISGSVIALYITGWSFSFFAFVGIISLIGIVVNNSIILVDYINQMRREGTAKVDAIIAGSMLRLKPIILTTLTTILGLIPLTLSGSGLWSPLCWTIIGGMVSSTMLTLVVVPVLYKWIAEKELRPMG
jgi:multidrug efflux pump subunit AcrB